MAKPLEKKQDEPKARVPFDAALKKILNAPPMHKTAAKAKKKTG